MLSDPRLANPHAALTALLEAAEVLNDPRTTHDNVGSSGKPGSRPPGRQQAPWLVGELARILDRAVRDANRAMCAAKVREDGGTLPGSIGGVTIEVETRGEWEDRKTLDVADGKLVAKKRGAYMRPLRKKLDDLVS
jgi:hypothetical protein